MSGDWIKMRCDLFTHPKVVRISSALKADTLRTVGGLMSAWCLFDAHSIDGKLEGYTAETLDSHIRCPGFSAAMASVGWLIESVDGLELPRFDAHNGQSAKRRAQDADRKKEDRKTSASEADKKRTREEKRREVKEAPPPDSNESASDPKVLIFTQGVEILKRHGSSETSARSFLGKYAGYDEAQLAGVIGYLMAQPKVEPKSYIVAAMTPKKRELVL